MFMDLTREVKAYCDLASQPCRRLAQKPRPTCAAKAPIGWFHQPVWLSLRTRTTAYQSKRTHASGVPSAIPKMR